VYKRGLEREYLPRNPQEVGRKSFAEAGGKELALHSSYRLIQRFQSEEKCV
jgi:hypothetical protein